MPGKYKKILIINTFGIGDVLFSTPMVRTLREHMPNAIIDFMCNKRCRYLMRSNKNIDDIIIFEKDNFREIFHKSKIEFIKEMCGFIKKIKRAKYDLAIDLSLGYQISLLLKLLGVKKRSGFNYRERGRFLTDKLRIKGFEDKHVVEYYLDILRLIGISEISGKGLELALPQEFERWADEFIDKNKIGSKKLIGIAPGGGKSWGRYAEYRRWEPKNFAYVAERLSRENEELFFLIFGSKEEKKLSQPIEEALGGKAINLCGKLPLPQSIAFIKKCQLLLCNDGGILHIAVSQGVKTVSIFGPVDDKAYGPYPMSDNHKVVKVKGLGCGPCYRKFKHKMCKTHNCLKMIDKDIVLKCAEKSLVKNLPGLRTRTGQKLNHEKV
ncbi:MAG: glycosyltransferase family 9 protein [Candidatus Omnitrophota bacterium]|nr:MAG: glycosyltransferase family 9 protein [Candidatus Omnitrophota bacterium]